MASTASPDPPQQNEKNLLVLISGSGSNLQALIDACTASTIPHARIAHVISDRKDAYGLTRARAAGIPTTHHGILPYKKKYPDSSSHPAFQEAREAYDAELARLVLQEKPDLVVCAGFMRILTTHFLDPLATSTPPIPIINLHPSLHGDLIGANCIQQAWEELQAGKRKKTGVMVHFVIRDVDMGRPVLEREVQMEGCGTLEELEGRVHEVEHGAIVEGVRKVLEEGK